MAKVAIMPFRLDSESVSSFSQTLHRTFYGFCFSTKPHTTVASSYYVLLLTPTSITKNRLRDQRTELLNYKRKYFPPDFDRNLLQGVFYQIPFTQYDKDWKQFI